MAKNGGNTTRVCDEVPQSGAPGAPFLTWAPIGAPIWAPDYFKIYQKRMCLY